MGQGKLGGPEWLRGEGGACPRTAWFSQDGCVVWSADGEHAQVMVRRTLIGLFDRRELGARNVVLLGLCRGTKVHYGKLAKAFRIGEEQLRKIRLRFEESGIEAVFDSRRRGRERVLKGKALRDVRRWFDKGVSQRAIQDKLATRGVCVGVGTICNEHKRWVAELSASSPATAKAEVPGDEPPEPPPVATADEELGETSEAAPIAPEQDEAATPPACVPAAEEKRGTRVVIAPAPPQSGRFVQHVGVWLPTARLAAAGLFESVEHETVFYVDNPMRPYHGTHITRRGWRMQDRRARPGNCDGWVHDEDGRRLLRLHLSAHDSRPPDIGRPTPRNH